MFFHKNIFKKIITVLLILFTGSIISCNIMGAEHSINKILVKYDFNKMNSYAPWFGWSLKPQTIRLVKTSSGSKVLQYTGNGWNTPIVPLSPSIIVTDSTALKFRIKTSKAEGCEINLQDDTENARYVLFFSVPKANQWTDVVILLKDATYKSGGIPGQNADGILGDKLSRVQLAFRGKKIEIASFEVANLDDNEINNISSSSPVKKYLKSHKKVSYPQLARNSVFPFGVIVTLNRGCRDNGVFFGQTTLERYQLALQSIQQFGFNTVSNFCNSLRTGPNLELMKKYHLYLLETATCDQKIYSLSDSAPLLSDVKKYSSHPNLLAWYGKDEPSEIEHYLKCKKRIDSMSNGKAPYTSAMNRNSIVQMIGSCMEVIIIDHYSLEEDFDPVISRTKILNHTNNINIARNSSMTKHVWMIPQAFGMRRAGGRTLRYPYPKETRLEVFNALALGIKGFIFFIYNEIVPYLDKQIRGEEFDQTMVDAWYNGNPTTDELSKLAKRLIPVIPSFLDTVPCTGFKTYCSSKDVYVKQLKNQYGTLIYCYNTNLAKNIRGQLKVKLPSNVKLYDIESLKTVKYNKFKFNLASGDGNILFAAKPDKFAVIAKEINFHRTEFTWQQLDVKLKRLAAAGFDTAELRGKLESLKPEMDKAVPSLNDIAKEITNLRNSNTEYCQISGKLTDIQKAFGRINAILTNSKKIKQIDCNSKWYGLFDSIKKLGTDYFKYKSYLDKGKLSEIPADSLNSLETKVQQLEKEVTNKING